MATRLKTVQYAFPALASLVNNTLTNLTQITVNLPENSKVFRSVVARISCDDIVTATGGTITAKQFELRVGAAAYTLINQTQTITNSGENISFFTTVDFTSQFATNFTGTSHTCDFRLVLNQSTGTTLGMVNVCVTLEITYEYDDTSATQIKTIYYPLKCNPGAMSQSTVTEDTIPALNTLLPEGSKVYRNIFVVIQGNERRGTSTADASMTLRVGAASVTTGIYEGALATSRFTRYVWDLTSSYPNTAASQAWQPTNSLAGMRHHQQAWLVVTYEYNEASTTRVMNSVMVPFRPQTISASVDNPSIIPANFGGCEEDNPITEAVALYGFFHNNVGFGNNGLNTIEYDSTLDTTVTTSYTDPTTGVIAGSNAFMWKRRTPGGSISPGQAISQSVELELYTGVTRLPDLCGYFLICYTSDKSSLGSGAHNHTVLLPLVTAATGSPPLIAQSPTSIALLNPETSQDYFITGIGVLATLFARTALPSSSTLKMWAGDNVADGRNAVQLYSAWSLVQNTEVGMYHFVDSWVSRFRLVQANFDPRKLDNGALTVDADNRYNVHLMETTTAAPALAFQEATAILTYHQIYGQVSGTLTGAIGFVNVDVYSGEGSDAGAFTAVGTFVDAPATAYSLKVPTRTTPVNIIATDSTGQITRATVTPS